MKIAVSGLGRMGMQIAHKLADDGHTVIANNRSEGPILEAKKFGAIVALTKDDVIKAFSNEPIVIWLMLPAQIIKSELVKWLEMLPDGSILIDGGNSDFRNTRANYDLVESKGCKFVDVGTSGGVWGYKNGFSMMVGGNNEAYETIVPALESLAKPEGAFNYFGAPGSGHFVKMVHNAIEYGMMESLAEGYRMLKEGPYKDIDLHKAGDVWQHHSVITSWLNELCVEALKENPGLEGVDGVVAESGEARWTLEVSKEIGLPMPAIASAFDVRIQSQNGETSYATKLLAAMRNKFGGHQINPIDPSIEATQQGK